MGILHAGPCNRRGLAQPYAELDWHGGDSCSMRLAYRRVASPGMADSAGAVSCSISSVEPAPRAQTRVEGVDRDADDSHKTDPSG